MHTSSYPQNERFSRDKPNANHMYQLFLYPSVLNWPKLVRLYSYLFSISSLTNKREQITFIFWVRVAFAFAFVLFAWRIFFRLVLNSRRLFSLVAVKHNVNAERNVIFLFNHCGVRNTLPIVYSRFVAAKYELSSSVPCPRGHVYASRARKQTVLMAIA